MTQGGESMGILSEELQSLRDLWKLALQVGNAPIDGVTGEFYHDRYAVFGPPPWGMTRVRVVRDCAQILAALEGGYDISIGDITYMGKYDLQNRAKIALLAFHSESSIRPRLTDIIARFKNSMIIWRSRMDNNIKSDQTDLMTDRDRWAQVLGHLNFPPVDGAGPTRLTEFLGLK